MKYKIDGNNKKPIYQQLYGQVKADIVSGAYAYNAKLPSKRTVAEELGISVITVEHAYGLLVEEGYAVPRERSGYFVIFRSDDGFAVSSTERAEFSSYHDGSQSEFPFSTLAATMRKVLNDCGAAILEKSPNAGLLRLRDALKRYLALNRGIYVSSDQIVIGSGAEYLYGLVIGLFCSDTVYGVEYPSYEKIEKTYRASNVKCELLPLGGDGIMSDALSSTAAQVLHITPYRSFPTGVTASASKRHEYIRWSSVGDRYIVEDDFESEFSVSKKPEETLFSLSTLDNVIYMNTFSRTVSPAMRTGYMVLPQRLLERFEQKLGFYSCSVPTFEQHVLAELIESGDFERHVNRVRRKKRKQMLKNK